MNALSGEMKKEFCKIRWCSTYCRSCSGITWTYLPPEGYCSSSCPGGFYANSDNWQCKNTLANLATAVDRGLITTPVWPVQQEEEAATVCDSCNPGTFLYLSQCLNPCATVLLAIGKTIQDISYIRIRDGRPVLEESLSCWLLGKHYERNFRAQ
jgi:hypothetical protein